jgi:hypothetical protein
MGRGLSCIHTHKHTLYARGSFWVVAPCRLQGNLRFRGKYRFYLQGIRINRILMMLLIVYFLFLSSDAEGESDMFHLKVGISEIRDIATQNTVIFIITVARSSISRAHEHPNVEAGK